MGGGTTLGLHRNSGKVWGADGVLGGVGSRVEGFGGRVSSFRDLLLRHGGVEGEEGLRSAGLRQAYLQQERGFPARPLLCLRHSVTKCRVMAGVRGTQWIGVWDVNSESKPS